MWSNVILSSEGPPSRCKHSCVLVPNENNYDLFLYGGRSGTFPLKDFWKLNLKEGNWIEIKTKDGPPHLQQHSIVHYKNNLYLFGGEISFSFDQTPLWIWSLQSSTWRRWGGNAKLQSKTPLGRRGHTAIVWNEYMLLYGGYRDLKGSLGDLWAFHFETESWHMFSDIEKCERGWLNWLSPPLTTSPPARHGHVSCLNGNNFYVHGGMNDLIELNDVWKFNLTTRKWCEIRSGPGPIHGHVAIAALNSMIILSGERSGKPVDNEFWRFDFSNEIWDKISFNNSRPCPRTHSWAGIIIKNVPMATKKKTNDYEALSESDTPDLLIDFESIPGGSSNKGEGFYKGEGAYKGEEFTTRRSESANCITNKVNVKKSASTVRFVEPCTSDYSSMENGISFENPNYNRVDHQQQFEMGLLGVNDSASINEGSRNVEHSYILLIGGNESHSSQVVKKPLSIWRLKLTNEIFGIQQQTFFDNNTTTGF